MTGKIMDEGIASVGGRNFQVRMLAEPDVFTKDSADQFSIPDFLAGVCRPLDTKDVKSASVIVDAHVGITECGSANTIGNHVAIGDLGQLPLPLRFPTIPPETSKVDIIIQNMSDGCWNVIKVIYLEKSISSAAALSMCSGKPFVPVFRNGPHAIKKAFQWALARVRGHHVHWHKLEDKSQDTLHKSSSNLWSPENDELAEGIRYINTFAPDCDALNQQTYWILTNIKPDSGVGKTPAIIAMAMAIGRYHVRRLGLHGAKPGWRRGKSLDNFRQRSPQIQEALFLDDPSGRRLDMADLKSFVTTDEDGTVSGRYNDARLTRNQFRALASNDTGDEPAGVLPADTTLDPEAFIKLLGPLFADARKKDILAVLKRCTTFAFTDSALYLRLPSERPDAIVHRISKGDIQKDLLAEKDKPHYNTYKNGLTVYTATYTAEVEREQAMIDERADYMASFPNVKNYIQDCNNTLQTWLRPVRVLPDSPESPQQTGEQAAGDLRLSLYIGTGPKPNRVDRASFNIPNPSASKARRIRGKSPVPETASASSAPLCPDEQETLVRAMDPDEEAALAMHDQ
ncbi:unnamed protein product [Symbiodinium sp. CCMP2592]|nr:unnamed protein product [Symbiodinium sp. CCMP2592]